MRAEKEGREEGERKKVIGREGRRGLDRARTEQI